MMMIDEHGRVPSTELNSSHRSRPGARERLGLRRRITSFATGATGHDEVIPRAMHVRARHRWPCRTRVSCGRPAFACPPATLAIFQMMS
jgi:hypothetical protein